MTPGRNFAAAKLALAVGLAFAVAARGASRPTYGKTLELLWATSAPLLEEPGEVTTPEEAAILRLWAEGACHAEARAPAPALTRLTQPTPTQLVLELRAPLSTLGEPRLTSLDFARAWQRLAAPTTRSPYGALLTPLRGRGDYLTGAALRPQTLSLPLDFAFPDLAEALCHPAFSVTVPAGSGRQGRGPYAWKGPRSSGSRGTAQLPFPDGRPYPEAVRLTLGDERTVARAYGTREGQVRLGAGARTEGTPPLLEATYLLFQPDAAGPGFRRDFEAAVDRLQLTQRFVPAPSRPLTALLPSAAAPPSPPLPRAKPSPGGSSRPLTLLYDATLDTGRAVAERLQVSLHDVGYALKLEPLSRAELRARWAKRQYELMLTSVLLPRPPAAALAVVLGLAQGAPETLARELSALGAVEEAAERGARAEARAASLAPTLPLLPLFVQGVRVQADATVNNLHWGPDGVPRLDEVFLGGSGGP